MKNSVIWDWNGTLLNDTDICVNSMNLLLRRRSLPPIDIARYKQIFTFPVEEYYKQLGFDFEKEEFSIPAHEYIAEYANAFSSSRLHVSAIKALSFFKEKGFRQFVLSAMENRMLGETLKEKGIVGYFDGFAGLQDHYAVSKTDIGRNLIEMHGINIAQTWLIGDTIHDSEVAGELGLNCFLIADGHQSAERLNSTGCQVLENLDQLLSLDVFKVLQKPQDPNL